MSYYKRSLYFSKRLQRYCNRGDWYAQSAYHRGLRSRSWFKLDEINCMDKLFYLGMTVVDLGSSPGGWALYAKKKIGNKGHVISCDIIPMIKIDGVTFLRGDCLDPNFSQMLLNEIGSRKANIILSDMSPKITGVPIVDISRSILLGRLVLKICRDILASKGDCLVKIFQGSGFDQYLHDVRSVFNTVKIRKPSASRSCSREVYVVGKEYQYHC